MIKSFAQEKKINPYAYAWLIWVIAALFYAYEFFIRISPTVMISELMQSFTTGALAISALSAFYYYAYAVMQIPVGVLLDNYGIRRSLFIAALIVALSSVLFSITTNLWVAYFCRILMGIGSAFSFIGCLKLASNWFSEERFPIVIGLTNTLGVIGAITGEAPLALMIRHFEWRNTFFLIGILGFVIALLIQGIIKDQPQLLRSAKTEKPNETKIELLKGLRVILKRRQTWLIAIYGGLMVAPISAFTELWSVPFLEGAEHLSAPQAALFSSIVFIGIGFGGPGNGWLASKLKKRKPILLIGALLASVSLLMVLLFATFPLIILGLLLFCFGFFTSSMLLAFALNVENNPNWASGVTIGFTNMMVMMGGTLFQLLVGWLLEVVQPGSDVGKLQFGTATYQQVLMILPACQWLAFLLVIFVKEKVHPG